LEDDDRLVVSRRMAIWAVVGVCALSAAIGSGITLLADTGPAGPKGQRGAPGPRGPEGPEGEVEEPDFGFLESELGELRDELNSVADLEARVDGIDSDLTKNEETVSELCLELELIC
jgi:hypothetical protein